ncbi:MAG: Non-motile and phage-resistance protein [Alphaproteobacteria bacterium MarineAlpha10_Bin3]|nr:MAG: Non-motile and phage-resistance protein [Alphaproteobacteria bacterium MarineAlpha10_Bin3]PPR70794.1 MAG: Non-motile and phage-resistance protein [Alphaproteobacteria bacterium MarineAlpha4_Bin1]
MDAVQSLTEAVCEVRSDEECRDIVAALDALRIAVAVFNDQDRLTYCNTHFSHIFPSFQKHGSLKDARYEDLLYYKLENGEIAGSQAINDPQGWVAHKLELRRNPTQAPYEERLSDGRWININERPLKNGGTIRIYADITASKADQFRVLGAIEDGTDALAFWDQRDRLIIRNDTFDALFNTPTKPLRLGMEFSELIGIAAEHHIYTSDDEPADWVSERLRLHRLANHREIWRHCDGRWFLVHEHRSRGGGIVMRLSDITEIQENERAMIERGTALTTTVHELEMSKSIFEQQGIEHVQALEELALAKSELESANASRSRFLSILSHELRTPMNAIIGFSEILEKELLGPIGNPKYKEYASDIFDSGQNLLSLINDLLDMSKLEAGKWRLQRHPADIESLIRSCCRLMSEQAAAVGAFIEVFVARGLGAAYIDQRAIRQVLLNLLSNALKFTGKDEMVRVSAWSSAENLLVVITDNGVGIQASDLARVFQPFE